MSSAIETTAFAASSTPAMAAVFLGLVSAILARRCRAGSADSANAAVEQIGGAVIENHGFLEIIGVLGLLILPQMNSTAFAAMAQHIGFIDATHIRRREARGGSEERDDADADPDAESSSCIRAIDGVRIGDDGVVLGVVVERGGRSDDEDVSKTHHAHLMWEAVINLAGGGRPHSSAAGRGGVCSCSGGGGASIEPKREIIGSTAGGRRSDPVSKSARI